MMAVDILLSAIQENIICHQSSEVLTPYCLQEAAVSSQSFHEEPTRFLIEVNSLSIKKNKKFQEELIAYFPWI
jgi:hypothetical protein